MTETWIVVCTELHAALGPYGSAEEALEQAKAMSEKDSCVYVPVALAFRGDLIVGHRDGRRPEPETDNRPHPGQYL